MNCRFCLLLLPVVAGFLGGCATPPSASLPNVQHDVASRSGLTVAWPQSAADDGPVEQSVAALLKDELTPDAAAAIALLNNRNLRATFEELGVSQAELIAASRLPNPAFSASVRWPSERPRPPNVEFNLGMDVLTAFLLPLRTKFSGEQLTQVEKRVAHEALSLAADAKSAALAVQARQEFRTRLAAILEVNEAAADLAQRQYDAGNINRLELLLQQSSAQDTRLELARVDAEIRHEREKLNRLLGLWGAQTNWHMSAALPEPSPHEPDFSELESLAIAQRLDLAAAKSQVALARAALDLKRKTRFLPASANLGIDTEREPAGNGAHTHVTGPNIELALPIFDQGQAEIARLSAESRQAEANYEALAIDIRSEVREARDALLAGRAAAEYYDHVLLPQRRAILRETLLHYNAMQKSNYELLLAKQQVLEAERARIDAWRDYWIARTELERAVGGRLGALAMGAPAPRPEAKR
jgi:cobalt-zinc-cadmium efflux system outer membrane protein